MNTVQDNDQGSDSSSPPRAVIVFDGVCVLCNGWVRFLLRHDHRERYRFAAMQGDSGRALLAANGLDPDDPASFLLIEYDLIGNDLIGNYSGTPPRISTDTDAMRRVLMGLSGVWRVAALSVLLPRRVRDPLYRLVARNRYRWFGRHDVCPVPDPTQAHRFV